MSCNYSINDDHLSFSNNPFSLSPSHFPRIRIIQRLCESHFILGFILEATLKNPAGLKTYSTLLRPRRTQLFHRGTTKYFYSPLVVQVGQLPSVSLLRGGDMKRSNSAPMIPEMLEAVELKPPLVNSLFSRRGLSTSNVSLPGDIVRPELSPHRQVIE